MEGLDFAETASYMLNMSYNIAFDLFGPQRKISKLFPTLLICGYDATPKEVATMLKAILRNE